MLSNTNFLEIKSEIIPQSLLHIDEDVDNWDATELESIDTLDTDTDFLHYEEFFQRYLLTNRPCLFQENLTQDWKSRKDWTKQDRDANSKINFEFLSEAYGGVTVDITNCDEMRGEYGNNPSCQSMTLDSFIKYWQEYRDNGYPASMPCLYLKDWHIMKNWTEHEYLPYSTPIYFQSDWLNEGVKGTGDDFKFVYMGPKGSWTPFHADVYGSFSWSANICGMKKWHLYPPGKESIFQNSKTGKVEYDAQHPGIEGRDYHEVLQGAGQVIFVPSGWHHVVWNLEDTISINHNWFNGTNVFFIWKNLRGALDDVENELSDLRDVDDFHEICQGLLRANHGMNYSCFRNILNNVLKNRKNNFGQQFGENHREFDILSIKNILKSIEQDEDKRYKN